MRIGIGASPDGTLPREQRTAVDPIVRAAPTFSDAALGPARAPFTGSWRQIADDVAHTRDLGAHEQIIDRQAQVSRPEELVDTALELAARAGLSTRSHCSEHGRS
jgi:hypothetical protein